MICDRRSITLRASRGLIYLLPLLVAIACSSVDTKPPPVLQDQISTLHVVSLMPQERLSIRAFLTKRERDAIVNSGAIYELIERSIYGPRKRSLQPKMDTLVLPLAEVLISAGFENRLNAAFEKTIPVLPWASVVAFDVVDNTGNFSVEDYLNRIEADALLVLTSEYRMSSRWELMQASTNAALYLASAMEEASTEQNGAQAIYSNHLVYQSDLMAGEYYFVSPANLDRAFEDLSKLYDKKLLDAKTEGRKAKIEKQKNEELASLKRHRFLPRKRRLGRPVWLENDALLLKQVVDEAIDELPNLLSLDLKSVFAEPISKRSLKEMSIGSIGAAPDFSDTDTVLRTYRLRAWPLEDTESRSRLRTAQGHIYSYARGALPLE